MGSTEMASQTTQAMAPGASGATNMVASSGSSNTLLSTILIVLAIFVAVIVIENVVQYFLSRSKKPMLGLILPLAHIVYAVAHSLIVILPNKTALAYVSLNTALQNNTMRLEFAIMLVGVIALELLCEYFLVRKTVKLNEKLNPPAAEPAAE